MNAYTYAAYAGFDDGWGSMRDEPPRRRTEKVKNSRAYLSAYLDGRDAADRCVEEFETGVEPDPQRN
jgi:hypothetical protein